MINVTELENRIHALAKECELPGGGRAIQASASILYSLLASLKAGDVELLMQSTAKFSEGQIRRLTAHHN